MANEQKLNNAANAYVAGTGTFEDVYNAFIKIYRADFDRIASALDFNPHDVQAGYEDALLGSLRAYMPGRGTFTHYLNKAIKNKMVDIHRDEARRNREVLYSHQISGEAEEGNPFYTVTANDDTETEVIYKEISDKQKILIAEMLADTANIGANILEVCREIQAGNTVHGAAKHVGMCHKTARRRLDNLSSIFNANKYGNIRDYYLA